MNNVCCICLEPIKRKSYLQKCLNEMKTCSCEYYMHNLCLLKYMDHKISLKKNIDCIYCKSNIITYESCIFITDSVINKTTYYLNNVLFFIKILFFTVLLSTFLNLYREILLLL